MPKGSTAARRRVSRRDSRAKAASPNRYDYGVATVYGFLKYFGLEKEVKTNIEQGHAILAGHSFEHP